MATNIAEAGRRAWDAIAPYFTPPAELAGRIDGYRSPLIFDDGTPVTDAAQWPRRRQEILDYWHGIMGPWPELIQRPQVEYLDSTRREGLNQHQVRVQVDRGQEHFLDGYLLVPQGQGPFGAVVVVFYEAETSIGLKAEGRDFGLQIARRGMVTLNVGRPAWAAPFDANGQTPIQPLSYLGYLGANCCNLLANLPYVDPGRIGIMGHSYGGKWAMFASCFYEKFACAAWSDPGIVFDEARPNVNYWEPWYLGKQEGEQRGRGIITPENPRTGVYNRLIEQGRDLHELHALMAPRPFLVSAGSEDPIERWIPLNHTIEVNRLLGYRDRVAMTNRPTHGPTDESNAALVAFFEHFLAT